MANHDRSLGFALGHDASLDTIDEFSGFDASRRPTVGQRKHGLMVTNGGIECMLTAYENSVSILFSVSALVPPPGLWSRQFHRTTYDRPTPPAPILAVSLIVGIASFICYSNGVHKSNC